MKKIYLSALAVVIGFNMNAQKNEMLLSKHDNNPHVSNVISKPTAPYQEKATVVWSDDFSNPSTWTMNNTSTPISWDWVITTNQGDIPNAAPELQPFNSTTGSNGFALIDSDGQPGNTDGDGAIIANIRNATPIDLSASPNVVLQFQHSYRWWHEDRGVRVSGDNGATWTDYYITSDNGGVIPTGYPNNQNSENPVYESINISAVAGGQSQVLIEFFYNDNDYWGWYWVVDDAVIIEQPLDDVQLWGGAVSGENNEGMEYGRTPLTHLDANYYIGGQIHNFGVNDQTGIVLDADFTAFTSQTLSPSILSGDTVYIETLETPSLPLGVYNGDYMVQTDNETTGSPEFGDNTYERNFEVTNDLYSLDYVGGHPAGYEDVSDLGTGSFVGSEDFFVVGVQYRLKATDDISGIRVLLAPGTVDGGQIVASLKDTTTWFQSDMTSLFESQPVTVSPTDVTNGYIDILFDGAQSVPAGAYYACVTLESYGNSFDIQIVDDQTVPQPFFASMIYIEGDQIYSNGTACGVQLLTGTGWGANIEENTLSGISIYPNPSEGMITITNDENLNSTVEIFDMVGRLVYSTQINSQTNLDLAPYGAGTYMIKVSNDEGSYVEQVVIK